MNTPKKVFVSYKYSDVVEGRGSNNYRDILINELEGHGFYHKGEDDESEDLDHLSDEAIANIIGPDIKNSSITIILISPNAYKSKWIDWEISYSLRERAFNSSNNMTRNGIIGVLLPYETGSYQWGVKKNNCGTSTWFTSKFPKMARVNSFNISRGGGKCDQGCCTNLYYDNESYIVMRTWEDFISNKKHYIDKAWDNRERFDEFEIKINVT